MAAQLHYDLHNEIKAYNAYCSKTGFMVRTCRLFANPSLPWVGASPDGLVKDPSAESFGFLEITCPFMHIFLQLKLHAVIQPFLYSLQMARLFQSNTTNVTIKFKAGWIHQGYIGVILLFTPSKFFLWNKLNLMKIFEKTYR